MSSDIEPMEERPTAALPERRKSRLVRFSLRFLLLAITLAAVALGILAYHIQRAQRQKIALAKIEELGGRPLRTTLREGLFYSGGKLPEPRFKWMHQFLGEEYFVYVPMIDVRDPAITAEKFRAMIPYLRQVRLVKGLNEAGKTYIALNDIGNPNVDDKLISELKLRIPQCVFASTIMGKAAQNANNPF
jgi:hypothetical protein